MDDLKIYNIYPSGINFPGDFKPTKVSADAPVQAFVAFAEHKGYEYMKGKKFMVMDEFSAWAFESDPSYNWEEDPNYRTPKGIGKIIEP